MSNNNIETLINTFQSQANSRGAGVLSDPDELQRPLDTSSYLFLIEWVVESDQVTLHHFNRGSQKEQVQYLGMKDLLQRVAGPDRKYIEQLATYLVSGELERCEAEFRIVDASGNLSWVYGKGLVQYQGHQQVAKIVGLVTDIQTQEQIFEAPGSTYPFFGEINALPVGIIQLDLSTGVIDTANEAASQILQLSNTVVHSFPDTDTADWVSLVEILYRQNQVFNRLLRLPSLNRWLLFSGRRNTGDKVTIVLQDVTVLKEESVGLQKMNAELDNFVYHASHDLRTPLHSILGSLSLLKKEDNPQERARCVELIEGSITRLDTFITDLLSISRNQLRENPLVPVNFMVEIETAVAGAYHMGNTQNLEVVTKVSQPCPFVADLTRVRVVLNNLISNAIKYRRYDVDRSHITIEVWVGSQRVHIEVADNGEGIADTEIDRIFDMFHRASERSEGSGLGLYIVKDVVKKLEGTISVQSQVGQGTTFSVVLPNKYEANP